MGSYGQDEFRYPSEIRRTELRALFAVLSIIVVAGGAMLITIAQ